MWSGEKRKCKSTTNEVASRFAREVLAIFVAFAKEERKKTFLSQRKGPDGILINLISGVR